MSQRDAKASRDGHPGEGVEPICLPGYREGDLSEEELHDGLVALAAIAQDDGRDHDADILLDALDRLKNADLERRIGAAVLGSLEDQAPDIWLEVGTAIATDEGVRELIREGVSP